MVFDSIYFDFMDSVLVLVVGWILIGAGLGVMEATFLTFLLVRARLDRISEDTWNDLQTHKRRENQENAEINQEKMDFCWKHRSPWLSSLWQGSQSLSLVGLKESWKTPKKIFKFTTPRKMRKTCTSDAWIGHLGIIIWPFSYFELRMRLHIVILEFRDEIETL